jgi:hypothetical protein
MYFIKTDIDSVVIDNILCALEIGMEGVAYL